MSFFLRKAKFKYASQLDNDSIRLVRFRKPGLTQRTAELSLELSIWQLQDSGKPGYHALSYTWGPSEGDGCYTSSDMRPILLNGRKFHVYPNLHDALVQLQNSLVTEYHWIDAICINQEDESEKAAQVSMMAHIYFSAAQVNVWVGRSNEDTPMVMALIRNLAMYINNVYAIEGDLDPLLERKVKQLGLPSLTTENWLPLVKFYFQNWFKRSWVIQEVALARNVHLVMGNKGYITWKDLTDANGIMNRLGFYPGGLTEMQQGLGDEWMLPAIGYPAEMIMANVLCKSRDFNEPEYQFLLPQIEILTGSDSWRRGTAPMLAFLLTRCRRAHASDQRDKVYSLLGIAKFAAAVKGAPPTCIEVDYTDSSTPATVFTKATAFILEECNHLAFISLASLIICKDGENLELTPDLPSWVPDFSTSAQHATTMPLLCYSKHFEFDASWYRELGSLGLRIYGAELHVKAVRIGTLSVVSTSVAEALMRTWEFEPFAGLLLKCAQRYTLTGELAIEAFWRTLIFDTETHGAHPASPELGSAFGCWVLQTIFYYVEHSDLPGYGCEATIRCMKHYKALADRDAHVAGDMLPDFDRVRDTLRRLGLIRNAEGKLVVDLPDEENRKIKRLGDAFGSLVNAFGHFRRFFLTEEGHMGMGGLAVEENDSVWVVSSCPVPLVLRPREDGSYQLIGDSYVHGIMHGEAVKNAKWEDVCIT
ncbi:HET domain-containing protein [Fusarium sp. Ph1]|nr:HET domain-containing protein [Fusarium sp. Ph1]